MKKTFKNYMNGLLAFSFLGLGSARLQAESLIAIDSLLLMQESKEGKKLAEIIKSKIAGLQNEVKKMQEELISLQQEISGKADILSKEALQEKMELLNKKKKDAERTIADKEEALRMEVQRDQIKLRDKQLAEANKLFEKEHWGLMIDKNTPGVLFVSQAIDKTQDVLKAVDKAYEASLLPNTEKKIITAQVTKNAGNEAKVTADVRTIKQA